MMLADLRAMRLGHDHAHEIVRLRVERRDPHRVAGVMLGLGQRALAEQQKRQRLRRRQMIGIESHDPLQERLGRAPVALRGANVGEQRQRADVQRRALEEIDEQPLRLLDASRRSRRARALDVRLGRRLRPGRRRVERATAIAPKPAAAGAWGGRLLLFLLRHEQHFRR